MFKEGRTMERNLIKIKEIYSNFTGITTINALIFTFFAIEIILSAFLLNILAIIFYIIVFAIYFFTLGKLNIKNLNWERV